MVNDTSARRSCCCSRAWTCRTLSCRAPARLRLDLLACLQTSPERESQRESHACLKHACLRERVRRCLSLKHSQTRWPVCAHLLTLSDTLSLTTDVSLSGHIAAKDAAASGGVAVSARISWLSQTRKHAHSHTHIRTRSNTHAHALS